MRAVALTPAYPMRIYLFDVLMPLTPFFTNVDAHFETDFLLTASYSATALTSMPLRLILIASARL